MADPQRVSVLLGVLDTLEQMNLGTALKKNLGDQSLLSVFEGRIRALSGFREAIRAGAVEADNNQAHNLYNLFVQTINLLNNMSNMNAADFIQQRSNSHDALDQNLAAIRAALVPFVVWHLQAQLEGGLQENIRSEITSIRDEVGTRVGIFQQRFQTLEENATKMLNDLKTQTENVIENAKQLDLAKRAEAKEISLGITKDQFRDLKKRFRNGSCLFGMLTVGTFLVLIAFLAYLLYSPHEYANTQEAVGASVVRVAFIGVVAALAAVFAKIWRGNLNMYYHTEHREHLATIIQQFVNAGENADQRGAIFIKLIDAVAAFGSSGLIAGSEEAASLKIVSEFLPNLLKHGGEK